MQYVYSTCLWLKSILIQMEYRFEQHIYLSLTMKRENLIAVSADRSCWKIVTGDSPTLFVQSAVGSQSHSKWTLRQFLAWTVVGAQEPAEYNCCKQEHCSARLEKNSQNSFFSILFKFWYTALVGSSWHKYGFIWCLGDHSKQSNRNGWQTSSSVSYLLQRGSGNPADSSHPCIACLESWTCDTTVFHFSAIWCVLVFVILLAVNKISRQGVFMICF